MIQAGGFSDSRLADQDLVYRPSAPKISLVYLGRMIAVVIILVSLILLVATDVD